MSRLPTEGDHLGESLAGLVDGHLDHASRERALAHLTHCCACRAEADALRRLRSFLLEVGARPAAVSHGLAARLLAIEEPGPAAVSVRPLPPLWISGPVGAVRPAGRPSGRLRPAHAPGLLRRPRVPRAAAASAALVLGLGGVLALGSPSGRPTRTNEDPTVRIVQVDLPAAGPRPAELVSVRSVAVRGR